MNPYTSSGSVATMTANVSGNDNLNDLGDGPRQPGDPERYPVGAVTRRLLGYVRPHRISFVASFVSAAVSVILQLYTPILIGEGIDLIVAAGQVDFDALLPLVTKLALVVVGAAAFQWLQGYCVNRLSYETVRDMRVEASDKLSRMPLSFIDSHAHGDLMSRYTNDVDTVRNFLSNGFVQVISSVISVIATFAMMLYLSWQLTLLVILMLIIMLIVIKVIGGKSALYFKKQQKDLGAVNGYIEETIEGQKVIKVFNHEENVKEEFAALNGALKHSSTNANTFASVLMPIMGNLSNINYAVIAMAGGLLCIGGFTTIGTISSFLQYSRSFSQPIANLSQQFNNILAALAGAERIFDVIDREPEEDNGYVKLVNAKYDENGNLTECKEHTGLWAWKHPHSGDNTVTYQKLEGDVVFENVYFSYDGKKTVLDDISLYAKPGQKIAFVGSTGAGKTTITNLLNRFYEIQKGKIRYDGINIQKICKGDLRSSLSMVLQDTHLFTGTIEDNIRYGKLDATHEEVVKAAKLANADSFITRLPDGYDTVITGDGANLSQGQRQLIAIARAAVADPPVLVLDEATSSIDTRTEHLIEKGMDKLMNGRTTFVIAHRLSTVRNADAIMVLEHGKIIERGSHDDLIKQHGKYYQLYTGQFELS